MLLAQWPGHCGYDNRFLELNEGVHKVSKTEGKGITQNTVNVGNRKKSTCMEFGTSRRQGRLGVDCN